MLALIVVLAVVVGVFGVVLWNISRVSSNEGPALGTNNPYPDGVGALGPGEDAPPYLPTPIISEAEEFRRNAHLHLRSRERSRAPKSWMEEPGAMEAAGLVDRPEPPADDPASGSAERA